jgi:hypothetical protein
METLDNLTKSFDKLVVTTIQNILGSDIKICKWGFIFTSIGIGINVLINSFYFIKMNYENNISKNKINLLLNENKIIIEGNITIYEIIKNNTKKIDSMSEITKNNTKKIDSMSEITKTEKNTNLLDDDIELCDYDFIL